MRATFITPILNVSDLKESVAWFEKLGWKRLWEWGEPASFAAVASHECEIFLCLNGQGGRGKGSNTSTFGKGGSESEDQGCWLSLWVEDFDESYQRCVDAKIEIMHHPEAMPWGVREFHLRHPDGHIFRVSEALEE